MLKTNTDKMLLTQPRFRLDIEPWIHLHLHAFILDIKTPPHLTKLGIDAIDLAWRLHATLAPKAGASNFPVVGRAK